MPTRTLAAICALLVVALVPAAAHGAVGAQTVIMMPPTVQVGQTGVVGAITLVNQNTGAESSGLNTACNSGNASPPCVPSEQGIVFTPTCAVLTSGVCTGADANVFALAPTAVGNPGSACPSMLFSVAISNPTLGTWRFTPQPPGTKATMLGFGAACQINFTFDVLKVPASDTDGVTAGRQTLNSAEHTQVLEPFGPAAPSAHAIGNGTATTVVQATPTLATNASGPVTVGSAISDTATVTGPALSPTPTGTVTFTVFAPGDTTCAGPTVFDSGAQPVAGGSASSGNFTPATAGTYRWIAAYSGDPNYTPVTGACNAANEASVVNQATATIATTASGPVTVGSAISDSATVTGFNPTGTVTFTAFAPGDTTCTGATVFDSGPQAVNGSGVATSGNFTPTSAGTYRWRAAYSGDTNNTAVTGACNAANETSVVNQATATIATTATGPVTVGSAISDSATVTGFNPTGTVTFTAFAPGDTTCTGPTVFDSGPQTLTGGSATSGNFTPTTAGTYRWRAAYSGDTNNTAVSGACNAANEASVVNQATATIATTATGPVTVGNPIGDSATVTGFNPTGTVTFTVFAPGDTTCTGPTVFDSGPQAVNGSGVATSGNFTPTSAGTYRWRAAYSGDTNNTAVSGACNAANEASVVNQATPTIPTQASPDIILGAGSLTDDATVTGRVNPQVGATLDFRLYGPNDATCANAPVFEALGVTQPVANGAVTSTPAFTPTEAGTYRWRASYSGDANNNAVSGPCNDANENVVVSPATTAISTTASANIQLGAGVLSDQATISGRVTPLAGATVDFRLYGPNDAACANPPVFESLGVPYPVSGGPVTSDDFTPTQVGTYRWIASYSGDTNNSAANGGCNDSGETTVVSTTTPTVSTNASGPITLGGQVTDTAVVTGRSNPLAGANIDFRLYGPNDANCTGTPAFQSLDVPYPVAGGAVTSTAFVPTQVGTYRWIAFYSGDANNAAVSGACNDVSESVVVSPVPVPAPSPTPAPTVTPIPIPPLSTTCTSRRRFTMELRRREGLRRDLRGARFTGATILDSSGKVIRRVTFKRARVSIDLRGLPKGRFTLRVRVQLRNGRRITFVRRYQTCDRGSGT